jgi:kumamolisin
MRNFGSGGVTCSDVIVNGGFESDEGWEILETSYPAGYTSTLAYTGSRSMRVGIPAGLSGGGKCTYSAVAQTITLTTGYSATLRYWVYPVYEDADEGDLQYVWLVDGYGTTHILNQARENLAGWVERELDLSTFAGQTVSLRFSVMNDGDDDTSALYVDDVALEVCP